MKGLILSGGKGTRLRPITFTQAKQLVPVANKPILFYGIEALVEAGVTDIGIVVGETASEVMEKVGDGNRWGAKITYIRQDEPLGLAHAVKVAQGFLRDDPFVMYLGDNILRDGVKDLVEDFQQNRPDAQILLVQVPDPTQFGVAQLEGEKVVRLVEKPKVPPSDLALAGVYLFTAAIHEAVDNIVPSFRNELEITDAIQYLIDHGKNVRSSRVTGWWKDTGKLEDLLEANRLILDTFETRISGEVDAESIVEFKVVVEEGATIRKSIIRGPAIIGKGALIEGSYVGPFTAIHDGVQIVHSEIEHSIVLAGASIRNLRRRVADSLIGNDTAIARTERKPHTLRFMVGDNCKIDLL
jgi:glucose-1-phosphate thymidylyltransferase